jgi:hypothetical protein
LHGLVTFITCFFCAIPAFDPHHNARILPRRGSKTLSWT